MVSIRSVAFCVLETNAAISGTAFLVYSILFHLAAKTRSWVGRNHLAYNALTDSGKEYM